MTQVGHGPIPSMGLVYFTYIYQWSFLVPLIGGRWYIIPQLAIYKWYILPIGWLYGTYHLLREPETAIEFTINIYHKYQPNVGKYTIHGSYGGWRWLHWLRFQLCAHVDVEAKIRSLTMPEDRGCKMMEAIPVEVSWCFQQVGVRQSEWI